MAWRGSGCEPRLAPPGMGTWHVDLRTAVLTHDENLNGILGLEPRETTGALHDPAFTRIHPDDQARVRDAIDTAIATRSDYSLEFRIVRADGHVRWLRDRGRIVIGDDGTPLFATGAVMDITEQRRLEDHDRMLAAATQVLATSVDYEDTLAALPRTLVPRFADWAERAPRRWRRPSSRCCRGRRDDLAPDERQVARRHGRRRAGARVAAAAPAATRRREHDRGDGVCHARARLRHRGRSRSRRSWPTASRSRSIARGCSATCSAPTA